MITRPKVMAPPMWPSWCVFASTMIAPQPAKTSANVPIASATRARASPRLSATPEQLGNQVLHPAVDLVADLPHRVEVLALRIVQLPVLVALAGVDRASISTAHRDHHVGGTH